LDTFDFLSAFALKLIFKFGVLLIGVPNDASLGALPQAQNLEY
jgi:hypothetical protein